LTCPRCKLPMREMKAHIFHKQRKFRCPKCHRARMQKLR
jgi:transposase-like protein